MDCCRLRSDRVYIGCHESRESIRRPGRCLLSFQVLEIKCVGRALGNYRKDLSPHPPYFLHQTKVFQKDTMEIMVLLVWSVITLILQPVIANNCKNSVSYCGYNLLNIGTCICRPVRGFVPNESATQETTRSQSTRRSRKYL